MAVVADATVLYLMETALMQLHHAALCRRGSVAMLVPVASENYSQHAMARRMGRGLPEPPLRDHGSAEQQAWIPDPTNLGDNC